MDRGCKIEFADLLVGGKWGIGCKDRFQGLLGFGFRGHDEWPPPRRQTATSTAKPQTVCLNPISSTPAISN